MQVIIFFYDIDNAEKGFFNLFIKIIDQIDLTHAILNINKFKYLFKK